MGIVQEVVEELHPLVEFIALPLLLTYSEGETEGRPNEETERAPTRAMYEWELFLFSISYKLSLDWEGTLRMGRL